MPAATEKRSQVGRAKDRLRRGRPIRMSSISLKYKRGKGNTFTCHILLFAQAKRTAEPNIVAYHPCLFTHRKWTLADGTYVVHSVELKYKKLREGLFGECRPIKLSHEVACITLPYSVRYGCDKSKNRKNG
ncbi:hypothetical protein XU18_4125 [Perkinsela sp. CCAP 1560/4]|nr:hypothetical protein XU18_4125 [Perkinsela sp. CCAP 1560/4]|eukprot:KNH04687.1 hypothetical protein XU18_4125 [Perkinsela sp. CCAP 1560/4]